MNTTSAQTLQKIYNRVATHLLTQNARATKGGYGQCMYRTSDGLKCAVGCLITDEAYSPKIEFNRMGTEIVLESLAKSGILVDSHSKLYKMLSDLQRIHDAFAIASWPAQLHHIATKYNLDSSVIPSHATTI